MEMTMQSFLEQQKKMLKEDLASLQRAKSKLKKTYDEVNAELAVMNVIKPQFGIDQSIEATIGDLISLEVKLHSQLTVINRQIEDIESAIENI